MFLKFFPHINLNFTIFPIPHSHPQSNPNLIKLIHRSITLVEGGGVVGDAEHKFGTSDTIFSSSSIYSSISTTL